MTNKLIDTINLPVLTDQRGSLSFGEADNHIPFPIKRIFYITNTPYKSIRGNHAHKITNQVLFCLHGSVLIKLDDGVHKSEYVLDKPNIGLLIKNKIWHSMENFSKDAVLLVVASTKYNEKEYLRDYEDFLVYINQK